MCVGIDEQRSLCADEMLVWSDRRRMDDAQCKMPLERVEVAVPMQQVVAFINAESRDNAVNRFAHCNPAVL